jgi:hypothetical protein
LVCSEGDGTSCINPNKSPQFKNSVWFEFASSGIYKYKDIENEATGENLGKVLLLQAISRDATQNPTIVWILVQAETSSEPGINKYRAFAQGAFIDQGMDLNTDGGRIIDITQWLEWNRKATKKTYSFLMGGRSYMDFLTGSNEKTYDTNASSFINNGGLEDPFNMTILVANGRTKTK